MAHEVAVQVALSRDGLPRPAVIRGWARLVLIREGVGPGTGLTVRIVGRDEGAALNRAYRDRSGPTNVLAFPFEPPPGIPEGAVPGCLGDIVVCAPVVEAEAQAQGKAPQDHWAHLVIHGALHLLGYDHLDPQEARRMEELERSLLGELGIADPYGEGSPSPPECGVATASPPTTAGH